MRKTLADCTLREIGDMCGEHCDCDDCPLLIIDNDNEKKYCFFDKLDDNCIDDISIEAEKIEVETEDEIFTVEDFN